MSTLDLVKNNRVNNAFVRANKHVIDTYKVTSFEELQKAWYKEFNCTLENQQLIFQNDRLMSVFLLQWG